MRRSLPPWLLLVPALHAALAASALEVYVAPSGNDANPGTRARPLATLEKARDSVRALRRQAGANVGATVSIAPGTYLRRGTFELTAEDGGTAPEPVIYRAEKGGQVKWLGGRILTGWHRLTDESIRSRLETAARDHVLAADLPFLEPGQLGQLRSRGFSRPLSPAHLELFYGGRPMTLARWPNEGQWELIAGFPESRGTGDDHGGKVGELNGGFMYSGDRPSRWQWRNDLWVHGYWSWDWANSYERIEQLDLEHHLVRTAAPHGLYGFRQGQRFYYLNVLEELDAPGEYYLDRERQRLYFWPPDSPVGGNEAALASEAMISVLETPLISLVNVSHLQLVGFALEGTRDSGIVIRGGTNNLVAGCAIRLIGNYGLTIDGGQSHRVLSCDIEDTGDGGVQIAGGDRQTLTAGRHRVENCHFQRQGRWSKCYVPAVLVQGVGHTVAHNLIHDHPHCAILYGGNDHTLEFNEIHHVALETGDVGAIYAGRDWTFRGNRIRHNYIHETGGVGMGSMGVYMDDCVSGTEIFGNIFFQVQRAAFLGGGRDHQVENNIFIECDPAVQIDGRGLDQSPVWHGMVYDFMKKQLAAVPLDLYQTKYPALTEIDQLYRSNEKGISPTGNVVARNLCAGGKWLSVGWHATEGMVSIHDNYVCRRDEISGNERQRFQPGPESGVWKTGFQKIPAEKIGLQDDEFRRNGRL
ncbi:MAG: right-handed parallel beta-helix repeat-containing protein [Verrucomicrobiota bacterium]